MKPNKETHTLKFTLMVLGLAVIILLMVAAGYIAMMYGDL